MVSTVELKTLILNPREASLARDDVTGVGGARLAHVAITVPDLDAAVAWYAEALGLRPLPERVESSVRERPRLRAVLDEVYDQACERFRVAFLVAGESVAVELF